MEKTTLIKIDMDLIADLRMQGRGLEAKEILLAYHENKKKENIQLKKEIISIEAKKKRMKLKNGKKITRN